MSDGVVRKRGGNVYLPGSRVRHPQLGEGTVIWNTFIGFILVKFDKETILGQYSWLPIMFVEPLK